jgi:hypothetical protein
VTTTGLPSLGNAGFSVDARTAAGSVPVLTGIALASQSTPIAPGCTLLLGAPADVAFLVSSATGWARRPVAIPPTLSLRGLPVYCQAAALSPTLALSSGLSFVVGD